MWFLFFFQLIFCSVLFAEQNDYIEINNETSVVDILPSIEVLDHSDKMPLQEVMTLKNQFASNNGKTLYRSILMPSRWMHFSIKNNDDRKRYIYIDFFNSQIEEIEFYVVNPKGDIIYQGKAGSFFPLSQWPIEHRDPLFSFDIQVGEKLDVYMVDTIHRKTNIVHPRLVTEEKILSLFQKEKFNDGIIIGIILFVCLYQLLLFIISSNKMCLYYGLFLLTLTVYVYSILGYTYQFIFPGVPGIGPIVTTVSALFSIFIFVAFMRSVGVQHAFKNGDQLLKIINFSTVITLAMTFYGHFSSNTMVNAMSAKLPSIVGPITILIAIFYSFRSIRQFPSIRYFFITFLVSSISLALYISAFNNIIEYKQWILMFMKFSLIVQSGALSWVIINHVKSAESDRINLIQLTELNKQLEISTQMAELSNKAKSQFLANMSHELRTPLNTIMGYSEILYENIDENHHGSYYKSDIDHVYYAGRELLSIVDNILEASNLENDLSKISFKKINVWDFLNRIFNDSYVDIHKNKNKFKLVVQSNIGALYSDEQRLRKILSIVLNNAGKFTQNGFVRLSAMRINDQDTGQSQIVFRIFDTGAGIDKEKLERIFDLFAQVDDTYSRKHGGIGLGLTLAKGLTKQLGGSIFVHSKIGRGSVFVITIPDQKKTT